jgi:hypothetical protein
MSIILPTVIAVMHLAGAILIISETYKARKADEVLDKCIKGVRSFRIVQKRMAEKRRTIFKGQAQYRPPVSAFSGYIEATFLRR